MEVIRNSRVGSLLLPIWVMLLQYYESSVLAKCCRGVSSAWTRSRKNSASFRVLTRTGTLSRAWEGSLFFLICSVLINLPGTVLRWIYEKLEPVFESSFAAKIGFGLVEETPAAAGWLMILILVIPYEHWNNAYSLAGFALLLLFAIAARMRKNSRKLDLAALGPYVVAFAAFILIAWPLSAYSNLSARFLYYHLACMFCVLVIVSTVERVDQLLRLAGAATTGLIAVSVYGVIQRIQGVEVNPSYVDLTLNEDMPGRVFSMFENPNAFGEILVLLIPLAVGLMLASRGWLGRFWGLLGVALGSVSLIMTYSRAGWVGLAVAALLFILLWHSKIVPVAILLGFAALPLLPDTVLNRILTIFNFSDTSTSSRFPLYEAAVRLIGLRPIQGAGLGSDAVRSAVKDLNLYHGVAPFVHAHNVYLQVWAETGILGLFAFVGSFFWTLKKAVHAISHKGGMQSVRLLVIGGISALAGIMVCGIADYIWHYPRVMLIFWFVFAVTLAGIRLLVRQQEEMNA